MLDAFGGGVDGDHDDDHSVAGDDGDGLAVSFAPGKGGTGPKARSDAPGELGDTAAAEEGDGGGADCAASVGEGDGLGREERFQGGNVPLSGRGEEGSEQAALLGWGDGGLALFGEMATGAGDELAGVRFLDFEDFGDAAVGIVERFAEDIGGAFLGIQLFEKDEDGEFERLGPFGAESGVGGGVDGFREPRTDVGLATGAGGLVGGEGEAGGGGNEKRRRVDDEVMVDCLPAEPDILHEVFGFGGGAEHAIGEAKEAGADGKEGRKGGILRVRRHAFMIAVGGLRKDCHAARATAWSL